MSVNKVIILGRLGGDPETRYLPSGDAVCNFSVATSEKWKDKSTGEQQERTEWHRCSAFGRTAEVIAEYFLKGSEIYLEGKLQTRKWQAQDGTDKYSTEIRVDSFSFTGGSTQPDDGGQSTRGADNRQGNRNQSQSGDRGRGSGNRNSGTSRQPARGGSRQPAGGNAPAGGYGGNGGFDEMDDDIPF